MAIKAGDRIPEFSVLTDEGKTITSEAMSKDAFVLFAYPKADTPGCTNQACGFRDNAAVFAAKGYKIYGISADTPAEQTAWKQKNGYTYPLLCDTDKKVLSALGMLKEANKINRSHIVVGKDGVVQDAQIGVAWADSVPFALKVVAEAKAL